MALGLVKSLHGTAFINGSWVDAHDGSTFEVTNPADETVIAEVANCGEEETKQAMKPTSPWIVGGISVSILVVTILVIVLVKPAKTRSLRPSSSSEPAPSTIRSRREIKDSGLSWFERLFT